MPGRHRRFSNYHRSSGPFSFGYLNPVMVTPRVHRHRLQGHPQNGQYTSRSHARFTQPPTTSIDAHSHEIIISTSPLDRAPESTRSSFGYLNPVIVTPRAHRHRLPAHPQNGQYTSRTPHTTTTANDQHRNTLATPTITTPLHHPPPPPPTTIETRPQRKQSQVRPTGQHRPHALTNEPAAPPVHAAAAAARRRSVRLKRTNLRVRGLSLNRSQQWTPLLRTTPPLTTRSSTNDLAPLHRM